MKNKEYYHTSVEIEEYPFPIIQLDDLGPELVQTIKDFNNSKDIEYKRKLAEKIPIEFPKCRFCSKTIINSNFRIDMKQYKNTIQIFNPGVYCREIDGKKYYLSCCKDCLLEHFKDNPPKAEKYYFMKANVYGQYCFGYSDEEYKKICSMTVGVTEKSMIRKWGKEEGLKKWKEYCDKHSYIASKDFYIDKYGEEEGLKMYHDSRAITEELCIKRYGVEEGKKRWQKYCDLQRYSCTLDYFVNTYGEEDGTNKFNEFCRCRKNAGGYSEISQELFNIILDKLKDNNINNKIYFATHHGEYKISDKRKLYSIDFYDKTKNLVIEFNGDYWHANPIRFKGTDIIKVQNDKPGILAEDIWKLDQLRKAGLCELLNNPIYIIVWENDYKRNKEKVINQILKHYGI